MSTSAVHLPQQRELDDRSVLERLADAVGARDIMVFRQVQPGRFLQLGGLGRGVGWAGNIDVHLDLEPVFCEVMASQQVHVWPPGANRQVIGPYFAAAAALVPVSHDVAVLFGSVAGPLSGTPSDLRAAAVTAVQLVEEISPSKALADELEVLHAVRAVVQCRESSVAGVLAHVAQAVAEALSCEVGLAWLPERSRLALVDRGWSLGATEQELVEALVQLSGLDGPVCVQDSSRDPLPSPLSPDRGVRSHFVVPLGQPCDGVLVLLHTDKVPRGFTDLCRQVGEAAADAAGVLVHSALMREELERLVDTTRNAARVDWLTGLANRRGWDEALTAAQETVRLGSSAGVLIMDVDRLKSVNDLYGHDAGDRYLRAAGRLLLDAAATGDVIARIGGDEFAVLVQSADPDAVAALAASVQARLAADQSEGATALSASVGYAVCVPGGDLTEAVRQADGQMYLAKAKARSA